MLERIGSNVTADDLIRAMENKERERRTLDWKRDLDLSAPSGRVEMAEEAASLANAAGGVIVYGVDEAREGGVKTGAPGRLLGCPIFTADTRAQIESLLRDLITPRLPMHEICEVEGGERGPLVLFRVPRSWTSPHMVKHRFYSRNSNGKYLLDVHEVRRAMTTVEERIAEIDRKRRERMSRILSRTTTYPLDGGDVVLVMHIYSLGGGASDVDAVLRLHELSPVPLLRCAHPIRETRRNMEGLVTAHVPRKETAVRAFTQVFWRGGIECAATTPYLDEARTVDLRAIQAEVERVILNVRENADLYGLTWPLVAGISMAGVAASRAVEVHKWDLDDYSPQRWTSDRDVLVPEPVLLEAHIGLESIVSQLCTPLRACFGL